MFYVRDILPKLESELETKEITVITGMRQVGKTTILDYLYKQVNSNNKVLLDLENPLHRKVFAEENYDLVWNNLSQFNINNNEKAYIFIDEVQDMPEVSKVVKYLYDHWNVKFFLTGSSSYYLKNLFPESLAGRKLVFELFPLTFKEFLHFKGKEKNNLLTYEDKALKKNKIAYEQYAAYYKEYIEYGGFPKVVLEENLERKQELLKEIFTSYFEKDAKSLSDFREMSKLHDLINLLIPRIGSRLEINKLAVELSLSRETIYNYLSFLEQTYFISLLPKFSESIDRQAAGSKKLYMCDTGIINALGRVSQGQLFEQSIFQNLHINHELYYYTKEGRSEIDFIVDKEIALEVKLSASQHDINSLKRKVKSIGIDKQYVVSLQFNDSKDTIMAIDL